MWAVFENGKQISKAHPHEKSAEIEAFEMGAIISGRFNPGKGRQNALIGGYEIKEIPETNAKDRL